MDTEVVTIQLPLTLYDQLQELATVEQTEPVEVIARLVTLARGSSTGLYDRSKSPTLAFQRILEHATDLECTDLAEQHDHYLYGTDKRRSYRYLLILVTFWPWPTRLTNITNGHAPPLCRFIPPL